MGLTCSCKRLNNGIYNHEYEDGTTKNIPIHLIRCKCEFEGKKKQCPLTKLLPDFSVVYFGYYKLKANSPETRLIEPWIHMFKSKTRLNNFYTKSTTYYGIEANIQYLNDHFQALIT